MAGTVRGLRIAAIAVVVVVLLGTGLGGLALAASIPVGWTELAGAGFVIAGAVKILAALTMLLLADRVPRAGHALRVGLGLLVVAYLLADISESHAAARLSDRLPTLLATLLHQAGAALWLGGLPWFLLALRQPGAAARGLVGRRYSHLSITGVGLILAGAGLISIYFIGSPSGLYGTAYGAMAVAKGVLMGILLLLGLGNFIAVRRFATLPDGSPLFGRVRRSVQLEMGFGVAVLMAAASITSLPPAVDLPHDRATLGEIGERLAPRWPRMTSPEHASLAIPALQAKLDAAWRNDPSRARPPAFVPGSGGPRPPRTAHDVAWSEYNHHWAGIIVLLVGLGAALERTGRAPAARHWPLLFLLLAAFLALRADPEVWPMGDVGLIESLKDPEVVQHRMFTLLVILFAFFEWSVRTGRIQRPAWAQVFPMLTVVGGTLLLSHSHALANIKDQFLVELSHLPIGLLGVVAGWSRWLQIKAPDAEGRWAGWVWPACFTLAGLLLVIYREA